MHLGVDVDVTDQHRATPLHAAVWGTQPGAIELLAEAGADLEAQDESGMTPLVHACLRTREDKTMAEILVDVGANVHSVFPTNGRYGFRSMWCWGGYRQSLASSLKSRVFPTPLRPNIPNLPFQFMVDIARAPKRGLRLY